MHLRLMHFTDAIILKSPVGPSPRLHTDQFEHREKTACLATWADGRFIQQRYCQNYFLSTAALFFSNSSYPGLPCPPGSILLFLGIRNLLAGQDLVVAVTLPYPLELPVGVMTLGEWAVSPGEQTFYPTQQILLTSTNTG